MGTRLLRWVSRHPYISSVLLLVGLSGMGWAWLEYETARAWDRLGREVDEMLVVEQARVIRRPTLRPPSLPSNAFEDYQKLEELPRLNIRTGLDRHDDASRSQIVEGLSLATEARSLLRNGTRRRDLRYVDLESFLWKHAGKLAPVPHWMPLSISTSLEAGNPEVAFEDLRCLLQWGRDMGEIGAGIFTYRYTWAAYSALELIEEFDRFGELTPERILSLEQDYAILDLQPPDMAAHARRVSIELGLQLRREGLKKLLFQYSTEQPPLLWPYWKDLFSWRHAELRCFYTQPPAHDDDANMTGATWWVKGTFDSLDWARGKFLKLPSYYLRQAQAWIRLTRMSLAWRRSGTCEALPDPFGGLMHAQYSDREFKAWSNGVNGVDDGGGSKANDQIIRVYR